MRRTRLANYTQEMAHPTEARRGPEPPDLSEKGGMKDGQPQRSDERLFMQFLAFGGSADSTQLADTLARAKISGALYEDVNDPRGIGLLTFAQDPDYFIDRVRPVLNGPEFSTLTQKPEYTMLGRTYAIGYEPDLTDVLLNRPLRRSGYHTPHLHSGLSTVRCGRCSNTSRRSGS